MRLCHYTARGRGRLMYNTDLAIQWNLSIPGHIGGKLKCPD